MDPEQLRLLELAIREHGAAGVIQAILQAHPELRDQILNLVAEIGPDMAIKQMFQLPEEPVLGPEAPPETTTPGASPEITNQAASAIAEAMPQTLSGLPEIKRPVNLVGLGAPQPEKFQTSPGQREMGIAPQPVNIEVPRPERAAPVSDGAPQQVEPEAPTQAIETGGTPAMDMPPAELPDATDILTQLPPASIAPGLAMAEQISLKEKWKAMGPNASSFSTLCAQHKLPMEVVVAMVKHESNFDPCATSDVGAMGLLQLMPGTARDQGLKVTTRMDERLMPKKNLSAGLGYLSWLKSNYKPKTLDQLLAAYNAGPGRLKDNAWKKIPETTRYVGKIKKTVQVYRDDPGEFGKDLSSLLQHLQ